MMQRAGEAGREALAAPTVIGVLGAGTMGAGIAQLALPLGRADAAARPDPGGARERRGAGSRRACAKEAAQGPPERGGGSRRRAERLQAVDELDALRALRAGDRGRARAPGAQARALRAPVGDRGRGVRAGDQHLLAAR